MPIRTPSTRSHRYLITGAVGFVANHLIRAILDRSSDDCVLGIDRGRLDHAAFMSERDRVSLVSVDMNQQVLLRETIAAFQPDYVVHLASESSVGASWSNPAGVFSNNTQIFLHLLEAIRELDLKARVISVGSSEQYGDQRGHPMPIRESNPMIPRSPYAVARISQEYIARMYCDGYGLDIVMTRSFNHVGPGQDTRFAIPSFVSQIASLFHQGRTTGSIQVGNIDVVRDWIDVRDVVDAYIILLKSGKAGEVYNVCRGVGHSLREILGSLQTISGVALETIEDPLLIRPGDVPVVIGDPCKIRECTGWEPQWDLELSLRTVFDSTLSTLFGVSEEMRFAR